MKHTLRLVAVGAVMSMGCGPGLEAQESPVPESATTVRGPIKEKSHCVAQAIATARGQGLSAGIAPAPVSCFDTFAEAISHATKGSVQLGSQATVKDLKAPDMLAAGVIAVEYDGANRGGASYTLSASITCASGDLFLASLPATWDNRISSAVLYDSSCLSFLHFSEPNFQGTGGNCGSGCNLTGALDNNTSSIYLSSIYY